MKRTSFFDVKKLRSRGDFGAIDSENHIIALEVSPGKQQKFTEEFQCITIAAKDN